VVCFTDKHHTCVLLHELGLAGLNKLVSCKWQVILWQPGDS